MTYRDIIESWLGSITPVFQKKPIDIWINPSRAEFSKLTHEWNNGARALITVGGDLVFWHTDGALHSEIIQTLSEKSFLNANLVLQPLGESGPPIMWNELENWLADDFSPYSECGFRKELFDVWEKVVSNRYLKGIYGTVYPYGIIDDDTVYMTPDWIEGEKHEI